MKLFLKIQRRYTSIKENDMLRIVHNRIEVDRSKYIMMRRFYFRKLPVKEIREKAQISNRVFYIIVNENKWITKRYRYHKFLCEWSYRNNISISETAKLVGIKAGILHRVKRKMELPTFRYDIHNKRITKKIEESIIQDYKKGMTSTAVAKNHGFKNHKTVLDVLIKYNLKARLYSDYSDYELNYFNKIDSHDKAYILGLLLTDGYVIKDYRGFGIQLTGKDGYILDRIAKKLGQSTTVIHIDCSGKRKTMTGAKDMKRLNCHCPNMAKDLKKFCMVKRKTHILECPKIYNKYLSSFCRGLWDGDGSVGVNKRGRLWCNLSTCSNFFAFGFIKNNHICNFNIRPPTKKHCNWTIEPKGGRKETISFLKWIYSNKGDLYLGRKYEKVQNYIS